MGTAIADLLEKEEISLDFLAGRRLGIDSYNVLYQFLSIIRGKDGTPLMDSRGRVTSHLTGLLYRTINLLEAGIKPVFVFDGKPHELKGETLKARNRIRTEAKEKFEKARERGEEAEARKYAQQAVKLTEEMVQDAKKLVKLMGLPVIQAPSEGEAQISAMVAGNDLYGCVSQDFDALLFGASRLLRNITVSGKRKAPGRDFYYEVKPEMIELEKNLKALGIDRKKLIWIGILIGTDFNEKFPKIGPKTALKLVQEHEKFEGIIKATGHDPEFDYREIEEIFLNPESTKGYEIKFTLPEKDKILSFLCGEHDFSEERVQSALAKLEERAREKGQQSRLGQWL
ncbi:MAG: flap endonuclease-1 [Candidatus Diapherotrites archaeon]|uniref:Flap endonuclease 1 n=1 Tax=Candidatus Iainarchaeum sp. TaxID=3101447 RepID=A0A938YUI5_9ARCH|nr:flap endonuclease-1 [Candidatus Diapherotrites archaeon]